MLDLARAVVLAVVLGGCVRSATVQCDSGNVCPANFVCDDVLGTCVSGDAQQRCDGMPDGHPCMLGDTVPGSCDHGFCFPIVCGNNITQPGEVCDDGNNLDRDGCRGDCLSDETCGNGVVDYQSGEQCDCGSDDATRPAECAAVNGAGTFCTSDCKLACGNGVIDASQGELCDGAPPPDRSCLDFGYDEGSLGCSAVCTPGLEACGLIGWQPFATYDEDLIRAWAVDPDDLWAVGPADTVVRFQHGTVQTLHTGVDAAWWSIWGSSSSDVFVGGLTTAGSAIEHYDGTTWSPMTVPMATDTLIAMSGSGPHDVWAVGADTVLHYDGTSWASLAIPAGAATINDVWVASPGLAYLATESSDHSFNGKLVKYAGTTGSLVTTLAAMFPQQVWAPAAGTPVYVGTQDGKLVRVDGTTVTTIGKPAGGGAIEDLWGDASGHIHALEQYGGHYEWDGSLLTATPTVEGTFFASSLVGLPGHLFAVGTFDGTLVHTLADGEWTPPQSIGTSADGPVAAFSPGSMLHVGEDGDLYRWNGVVWTSVSGDLVSGTTAMWGLSPTDFFYASGANITRSVNAVDGEQFLAAQQVLALWGTSASTMFAVGQSGAIFRRTSSWAAMPSPTTQTLHAVWGADPTHLFAVGDAGTILHYDGTAWTSMTSGTAHALLGVWGTADGDVWAVGESGTILHYDGTSWTPREAPGIRGYLAVAGTSATDVWAVGQDAQIAHYDGASWTPVRAHFTGAPEIDHLAVFPDSIMVSATNGEVTWLRR